MPVFSDLKDLLKKATLPNTYTVVVSEYEYGFIKNKYVTTNDLEDCITIIKNRYKHFQKEKDGYKSVDMEYIEEDNYLEIKSHFCEDFTFSTNIQIMGISKEQHDKIEKILIKIFGDFLALDW